MVVLANLETPRNDENKRPAAHPAGLCATIKSWGEHWPLQEIRDFHWLKVLDYGLCTVRYQYHIRNNNNGSINYVENTLLCPVIALFTLFCLV